MTCLYCSIVPSSGPLCHFHERTRQLAAAGRCIWCLELAERGSYCQPCLESRLRQRGDRTRLHKMLSAARRRAA